jgi:RHS repeat-associated protein
MYGSSRLGSNYDTLELISPSPQQSSLFTHTLGNKQFELGNHLGNVLTTITDRKIAHDDNTDGTIDYYTADISSSQDYYPFGMQMPGRSFSSSGVYRYSFNGKEKDDEWNGTIGGFQDYGMRMYDTRVCRFPLPDPLTKKYPELTPYQFASNTPIIAIDLDGLETAASTRQNDAISPRNVTGPTASKQTGPTGPTGASGSNAPSGVIGPSTTGTGTAPKVRTDELQPYINFLSAPKVVASTQEVIMNTKTAQSQENPNCSKGLVENQPFLDLFLLGGPLLMKSGTVAAASLVVENTATEGGGDLALGLGDDLFNFAETKGFQTYKNFSTGFQQSKILNAIENEGTNLHFNLTGFSKYQFSKFNPLDKLTRNNFTNWELHTILNNPSALQRTTFYRFSEGNYNIVINPFK